MSQALDGIRVLDRELLPHGARLNAVFASDLGHWDVPDMRGMVAEAWELVEDGHLGEDDFRDFAFGNMVRMVSAMNPAFFDGTAIESEVRSYLSETRTNPGP